MKSLGMPECTPIARRLPPGCGAIKRWALTACDNVLDKGASPLFPPQQAPEARLQLEQLLHERPQTYGIERTRWRLVDLAQAISWLQGHTAAGIYQVLVQLQLHWKRARNTIRSPDPAFRPKWQAVLRAYAAALADPQRVVCLFLDEFTYYRQPSLAPAYHPQGVSQPQAHQVPGFNTLTRVVATLDAVTGRVIYRQSRQIDKSELVRFGEQIRAGYPQAERIYLVQDNWPPHLSPVVLEAWQEQAITPLFLPTYASWLNPIEKLWRWLKQDRLHLHPWAHDLGSLRQQVSQFLDQFQEGSEALLHYVGLLSV